MKLVSKDHGKFRANIPEQTGIFPIMLRIPSGGRKGFWDFAGLGTGFFVSKFGLFITAKHVVVEDIQFQEGRGLEVWIIVNGNNFTCPIRDIQLHPTADIAIGVIVPPRKNDLLLPKSVFTISLCNVSRNKPSAGAEVYSYGYPRTSLKNCENDPDTVVIDMQPDYYTGKIDGYHKDGVSICTWPVYRHSMPTASGMSGGSLFLKNNSAVIGVNCTGDSTSSEDISYGTATDVKLALDMIISSEIPGYKGKILYELLQDEVILI